MNAIAYDPYIPVSVAFVPGELYYL
jgi:hypothetical protein